VRDELFGVYRFNDEEELHQNFLLFIWQTIKNMPDQPDTIDDLA